MTHELDQLARALATKVSRREALKRAFLAAVGTGVAAFWPTRARAANTTSRCAQFCEAIYGANTSAANDCVQQAKRGSGPCFFFGPESPACEDNNCPRGTVCVACNTSYSSVSCPPGGPYDTPTGFVCLPT